MAMTMASVDGKDGRNLRNLVVSNVAQPSSAIFIWVCLVTLSYSFCLLCPSASCFLITILCKAETNEQIKMLYFVSLSNSLLSECFIPLKVHSI